MTNYKYLVELNFLFERNETIVGKRENAGYLLPQGLLELWGKRVQDSWIKINTKI